MQEIKTDKYSAMVDFKFLEQAGDIKVVQAPDCPWQFFVYHSDCPDRFAYYPSTGTVVYEGERGPQSRYHVDDAEELMELVMSKVNK